MEGFKKLTLKETLDMLGEYREDELYYTMGAEHTVKRFDSEYWGFSYDSTPNFYNATFYMKARPYYYLVADWYDEDNPNHNYLNVDMNKPFMWMYFDDRTEAFNIKTKFTTNEIRLLPEWCQYLTRKEVEVGDKNAKKSG